MLITLVVMPSMVRADDLLSDERRSRYIKTVYGFMEHHCVGCHGLDRAEAGVDLTFYETLAEARDDRFLMEDILERVAIGAMPPPDATRLPDRDARARFLEAFDDLVLAVDYDAVVDPGQTPPRRLNRFEYDRTIADLTGLDVEVAADFPADDAGNGFTNQGEVLRVSPLLMERYVEAAERIVNRLAGPEIAPESVETRPHDSSRGPERAYVLTIKQTGEYRVDLTLFSKTEVMGDSLTLVVDERPVSMIPTSRRQTLTLRLERGRHILRLDGLSPIDRSEGADSIDIGWRARVVGPIIPEERQPPRLYRRVVFARPSDALRPLDAAGRVLGRFAARAFRRPVLDDERDRLLALFEAGRASGLDYDGAVQLGLQAILASPQFLFRFEDERGTPLPDGRFGLSGDELATRLSYFLWSTMPDEELTRLALDGRLHDPEVLDAQVIRMLDDPKAVAMVEAFFAEWLNLGLLDDWSPDTQLIKGWTSKLAPAMKREVLLLAESVLREDRSVLDLLDAEETFINPRLAKLYGIPYRGEDPQALYDRGPATRYGREGPRDRHVEEYLYEHEFVRVPAPPHRQGVLTSPAILALTSNPDGTSPVKRGKWVLDNILGTPPPPPPPDVPDLEETRAARPDLGFREQLERHRDDPRCASCHALMDPIGLALENYDVLGRWRERYDRRRGGRPIDSSGTLADGRRFEGPEGLLDALDREAFVRQVVTKLFVYALGRGERPEDARTIDTIVREAASDEYRFQSLVRSLVRSDAFRRIRRAPEKGR